MSLHGQAVLITGGRRVGSDLARLLAERGASVAMTYHTSRDTIERTIGEIEAGGGSGLAVGADLTKAIEAERAVAEVVHRFHRLDALVNMASIYRRTPFASVSAQDFDEMIAANLAAPYHTAVAAGRQMLAQDEVDGIKGRIVNVGDWASDRPYKDYLPYLVAKGALATMTLALAKELAPHVLVTMIQPAMIAPPPGLTAAEHSAVLEATPIHRAGSPGDINRLILYLLDETRFATGACFRVDGGRFLGTD